MQNESHVAQIKQYTWIQILAVWAAAALPMAILGWVVAPYFAPAPKQPGFERLFILTLGLIWQFVLVVFLLYRETGTLRWEVIRERLWVSPPVSPRTGNANPALWLWLIPLILLTAVFEMALVGAVDGFWVSMFPFFAEPAGFSLGSALADPALQSSLVGNWGILILVVVSALFNTVLGEELLFRGVLLPRMAEAFGKWDWLANGILFGLYHLHQPWSILSAAFEGAFFNALPTKSLRSVWFGIITHSGQSVFFIFLFLGVVLGLAK